jgi:hypothetical protein
LNFLFDERHCLAAATATAHGKLTSRRRLCLDEIEVAVAIHVAAIKKERLLGSWVTVFSV